MVAEYPQEILDQAKKAPEGTAEFLESLTDKDYYPLLKPGDWMGIETGSVYQVLLGSNEDPKLVIAYAAETPSNYFFSMVIRKSIFRKLHRMHSKTLISSK